MGHTHECNFADCRWRRRASFRLAFAQHTEAALRYCPLDALAHHDRVSGVVAEWRGNRTVSSALLLGRNRQREYAAVAQSASSFVTRHRPDRLRIHLAGSERLEPLSSFPGCLAGGGNRTVLRPVRIV